MDDAVGRYEKSTGNQEGSVGTRNVRPVITMMEAGQRPGEARGERNAATDEKEEENG